MLCRPQTTMKNRTTTNATTSALIEPSKLDATTVRILAVYQRTAGIYERATAAMGRVAKYKVTMSNTATAVRVEDGHRAS